MSMVVTPDTPYGKELWKWDHLESETHPTDPTVRGMRPASFRSYPAMMYKATQKNPWLFDSEIAQDENQQRNLESRGFIAGGRGAAADAFEASMKNLAVAAAERNAQDRHMSENALAESNAAEQASSKHLGEIPRKPIKKRGRKVEVPA
jgi:hypothetical protein